MHGWSVKEKFIMFSSVPADRSVSVKDCYGEWHGSDGKLLTMNAILSERQITFTPRLGCSAIKKETIVPIVPCKSRSFKVRQQIRW